jgi:ApaG protein
MTIAITENISVSVQTNYQVVYSNPLASYFVFSYKIRIENQGNTTVQLLRRQWYIHDADGSVREVEGEGVIGEQPIIAPNQSFEYVSGCNLRSGIGKMLGYYTMQDSLGNIFAVKIPEFSMIFPPRLN